MKKGGNRWVVMVNGSRIIGPFGQEEAADTIRKIERRYRYVGLTPPRLDATRVQAPGFLDSWVGEDIARRCAVDVTGNRGG